MCPLYDNSPPRAQKKGFFSSECVSVYSVSGEGNGTPLQYSCLENPMDGGAWWAAVHGVARSRTWLSDFTFTFHFHALKKEMATHFSVLAWRIPGMAEPGGLPSMGSHRVGHDWSDLAAAAAAFSIHGMWMSWSLEISIQSNSLILLLMWIKYPTKLFQPLSMTTCSLNCQWLILPLRTWFWEGESPE